MTKAKQQEIIKWMCKHWSSEDLFDDAINHFGKTCETINFCSKIARKLNKTILHLPKYFEKEMEK